MKPLESTLVAVEKLPCGELVVRTTTIQSSSLPIPIPVNLKSFKLNEYCDLVKFVRTRLGLDSKKGTHAGMIKPSLVSETLKWHLARILG